MRRLRVLTWHTHGGYLHALARIPHDVYVPVKPGRPPDYVGLPNGGYRWPDNLHEVAAEAVPDLDLDVVLTQTHGQWLRDRDTLLSERQRRLPRIHLEHDPPREHPVDQPHPVDDPGALLVHVTHFNDLMWAGGRTPTQVIEHGVEVSDGTRWTGELERGIVVVNNLVSRGRRVGADVYARAQAEVPLDLVGMGSEDAPGGLGEVPPDRLHAFTARYRFFFNPIRYTSLGLAVCEAMLLGMPVVALATTEHALAVEDGVTGFVDTSAERLIERMHLLLAERALASSLGAAAREVAAARFGIERFVRDWDETLRLVAA